jgi:hypothetical protein
MAAENLTTCNIGQVNHHELKTSLAYCRQQSETYIREETCPLAALAPIFTHQPILERCDLFY